MATKYKTTGCFKFLIFLLIALPVAFIGSSYYHGEDPMSFIKNKIGMATETASSDRASDRASADSNDTYKTELNELRNEVRRLENENRNLKDVLQKKQEEIDELRSN